MFPEEETQIETAAEGGRARSRARMIRRLPGRSSARRITDRSGHTTLGMLRTYERDVRRWRELGEAPVAADGAIPELTDTNVSANVSRSVPKRPGTRTVTIRKCTGRELNPYALRRRNLNPLRLPVSPPVR